MHCVPHHRLHKGILQDLNFTEYWLIDMTRKLKYFGHVESHSGIRKIVMEAVFPGRKGRGLPVMTLDIEDVLDTRVPGMEIGIQLRVLWPGHDRKYVLQGTNYMVSSFGVSSSVHTS